MQMYRQIRKGSSLLWSSRIPPFTTDCMQKFPETKTARSRKIMAKRQMREERRRRLRLIRRKTGQNLQAGPGKMPEKRSYYEKLATAHGYRSADDVTSSLSLLVAADPAETSGKLKKAARLGVKVVSLDEFLSMLSPVSAPAAEEGQLSLGI